MDSTTKTTIEIIGEAGYRVDVGIDPRGFQQPRRLAAHCILSVRVL